VRFCPEALHSTYASRVAAGRWLPMSFSYSSSSWWYRFCSWKKSRQSFLRLTQAQSIVLHPYSADSVRDASCAKPRTSCVPVRLVESCKFGSHRLLESLFIFRGCREGGEADLKSEFLNPNHLEMQFRDSKLGNFASQENPPCG